MSSNPAFQVNLQKPDLRWDEELRGRLVVFKEKFEWSYDEISRAMQTYFGRKKSDNGRARNVGMSPAYINCYVNCRWTSSQESLQIFEAKLRAWLDNREHGGKTEVIDDTVISATLLQHGLIEANDSKKFVEIIAPSGMGKTLLAKHFANTNARTGMVIVEAYDGITPRAFLSALCRALGDIDTGTKDALIWRVAGLLAEKPRLLVVDEADFLKSESHNHLVTIWNHSQNGIALLGTEVLERNLRAENLQRIRTRKRLTIKIGALSKEEIRSRLEQSFEPKEVTPRVVDLALIASQGSYRKLDDLIDSLSEKAGLYHDKTVEQVFDRFHSCRLDAKTLGKSGRQ
jgi:DNA transposition AAA+ family ATPase